MLYSIHYFLAKTKMTGFFQTAFYFGYTAMFCLGGRGWLAGWLAVCVCARVCVLLRRACDCARVQGCSSALAAAERSQ